MNNKSIVLERLFDAPVKKVWKALTHKDDMKCWYFDLEDFQCKVGFKFQFMGESNKGIKYLHLCEVTEVIPNQKLTYSWRYEGYSGISFVTFELFKQGNKTLLRLTHAGIESFPHENTDFALHNFEKGWEAIIGTSLKGYLDSFRHEITVSASLENVFKALTTEIPLWWTEMFEGTSHKEGAVFTVRFGPAVFKTMRVEEIIPHKIVVWLVTDTLIDIPELTNKREWLSTRIIWELKAEKSNTSLQVTHIGLNPAIECYGICSTGWKQFCESLKAHLETGQGTPYKIEATLS